MKTNYFIALTLVVSAIAVNGCSSLGLNKESGKDISRNGPTVLNARTEPGTIQMNQALQPTSSAEILADVKDFDSKVNDVKLEFVSVPIQVAMQNIGGTTWRAELTAQQLQMLAVSGKTISYDANIVAKDVDGRSGVTSSPVSLAIKAPDLGDNSG
jgi:hypothetical protein